MVAGTRCVAPALPPPHSHTTSSQAFGMATIGSDERPVERSDEKNYGGNESREISNMEEENYRADDVRGGVADRGDKIISHKEEIDRTENPGSNVAKGEDNRLSPPPSGVCGSTSISEFLGINHEPILVQLNKKVRSATCPPSWEGEEVSGKEREEGTSDERTDDTKDGNWGGWLDEEDKSDRTSQNDGEVAKADANCLASLSKNLGDDPDAVFTKMETKLGLSAVNSAATSGLHGVGSGSDMSAVGSLSSADVVTVTSSTVCSTVGLMVNDSPAQGSKEGGATDAIVAYDEFNENPHDVLVLYEYKKILKNLAPSKVLVQVEVSTREGHCDVNRINARQICFRVFLSQGLILLTRLLFSHTGVWGVVSKKTPIRLQQCPEWILRYAAIYFTTL